ncbi:MAG: DUF2637 domain-containing protein [Pseudolysinimonas sp.]
MTNRARRIQITRNIIVSIGIVLVALAAFRLSFDAQTILAIASGADPGLGWIYPLTVDAAIVIVTLIALWQPDLERRLRVYLWCALALWTAASVAGNALHILALPAGRVELPMPIAVAVNTVPAVTLFLTIHIATTTVFRRPPVVAATKPVRRAAQALDGLSPERPSTRRHPDIPQPTINELMAMADVERLSMSQIAERVGRSKSWVGQQIKDERDRREAAA